MQDVEILIKDIYSLMDELRSQYDLFSNDYYFNKLAIASRFDSKGIIFIKRLLQNELPIVTRKIMLDTLFKKYVTADEKAFSKELYMDIEQIRCMARNGMYFGSHGYDHLWLDSLSLEDQEREVNLSFEFLKMIYPNLKEWVICYPYGAYNQQLLTLLRNRNCKLGFTTEVGLADFPALDPLTISRLDTNDLPKLSNAMPNHWTDQIIKDC
jgi:peptidoglycan/xylan/chitin deacetylase (PgdA/CDA1 family)